MYWPGPGRKTVDVRLGVICYSVGPSRGSGWQEAIAIGSTTMARPILPQAQPFSVRDPPQTILGRLRLIQVLP